MLGKLITWFKKLRKSQTSHDPAVAFIKSFWTNHESDDEDLYDGSDYASSTLCETFACPANRVR